MEDFATDAAAAEQIASFIGMAIGLVFGLALSLAILAVVAYLLKQNYDAIPAEHRKLDPTSKVWLLLIPLFNLYWMFVVILGLSDSYKSYFDSKGVTDVGDCYRKIGQWLCIAFACGIVPCLNYLAGPAALVLLVLYLVKVFEYKKRLADGGDTPPPAPVS